MPRVVHFEIGADDADRAEKFYSDVFGWTFTKWDGNSANPYRLIKTGEAGEQGIDGGMFVRPGPMTGHINTIDVPSVDEYAERIIAGGGKTVMPKMVIPGVGYLMYFTDTEDSMFAILERNAQVV